MNKKLRLILPNKKFSAQYIKAEKQILAEGHNIPGAAKELIENPKNFSQYLKRTTESRKGIALPKGRVPSTIYWAIVGNKLVGTLQIRHKLNKTLRATGGHIGYSVIPLERRKGYATEILRQALFKTKALGIKKVLVTCDETNTGSRKVIEYNGGKLENKVIHEGVYKLRFWIN